MILNLDDENEIVSTCVNLHLQVGFRVRSRNFIKGGAISAKTTFALRRLYPPPPEIYLVFWSGNNKMPYCYAPLEKGGILFSNCWSVCWSVVCGSVSLQSKCCPLNIFRPLHVINTKLGARVTLNE